jgi:N-acetyl-1-D-myo-inositol-2-amino-2-deoxy-alpha-D-glucopyranoside deacetylase
LSSEQSRDLSDPDLLLRRSDARLMVLAPHPDDESLAAGGLIQRAIAHGRPVSVVFVSDGENNPWPQRVLERRLWIGARQREDWGRRRRAEADAALQALGAATATVHRLGWPDGGITRMLLGDMASMLARMRELLARERPTLLVLPDLCDRHPDHSALHVVLEMVLQGMSHDARPDCLSYLLHGHPRQDLPNQVVFALDDAEVQRKRQAIETHASQTALSHKRLLRFAAPTEAFVAGLAEHDRADATLPWRPPQVLRPELRLLAVDARGGEILRLTRDSHADLRWRDGSPAAQASRSLQRPYCVKLYCPMPSPWVFDHWGWCRFGIRRA